MSVTNYTTTTVKVTESNSGIFRYNVKIILIKWHFVTKPHV